MIRKRETIPELPYKREKETQINKTHKGNSTSTDISMLLQLTMLQLHANVEINHKPLFNATIR